MNFRNFFTVATGHEPYPYQCRLACGEKMDDQTEVDWLTNPDPDGCRSRLINVPTGLGKTAAVVLAWLWNRVAYQIENRKSEIVNGSWPRRLVYCLPMRTLVEQTRDNVAAWLQNLVGAFPEDAELAWLASHSPIILMGGEEADRDGDIWPEKPAILIGTQDMLLSRALNRGYGMSRYRWPMHFGLLNNDCLWVMDETQLMGPGLSTACQLEAFRRDGQAAPAGFDSFGAAGSVTWYISATHNPDHLRTREWRNVQRPDNFEFRLSADEKSATTGPIHERRSAVKRLEPKQDSNFGDARAAATLIECILRQHGEMLAKVGGDPNLPPRTLIICNTVDRAVEVYRQLDVRKPEACDLLLMHSRFRPPERKEQMRRLGSLDQAVFPNGQIVVATQVVEAGVDVSSGILCSEVAPLASLVQRLGRLNRAGEFNQSPWEPLAIVVGVGMRGAPARENEEAREQRERENAKRCLPYASAACQKAWEPLQEQTSASPAAFEDEQIRQAVAASISRCPYSLQRHELLDFFDTDANLSLGFTDVSPFVRGLDEDTDIQVCWREAWSENDEAPDFLPGYQRDELCSVPVSKAKEARDVLNRGWIWRGKVSGWISVRDAGLAPGMTVLLPLSAGGYDDAAGWTGQKDDNKHASHYQPGADPPDGELLSCLENGWRSIAAHTEEVSRELSALLDGMLSDARRGAERDALLAAVPWHDIGKSHPAWQQAVLDALAKANVNGKDEHRPFAKFSLSDSPLLHQNGQPLRGRALKAKVRELRRLFRPGIAHEVASALAFRQAEQKRLGPDRDINLGSLLSEYVIMSHHGHVRKVLRDEIPKFPNAAKDTETVRGVANGDGVPAVCLGGQSLGCESLSTDCRKMGRASPGSGGEYPHESYTRGVLRLLERYGPFRLAFFEAVFRAADIRASILAQREGVRDSVRDELDRNRAQVARSAGGDKATAALGCYSGGCGGEYGFREGAGGGSDHPRDTRPDRSTRFIQTTRGLLTYTQLAPLLAERVTRIETEIYSGVFASRSLSDPELTLDLHRAICGDLVPDWAGRWRTIEAADRGKRIGVSGDGHGRGAGSFDKFLVLIMCADPEPPDSIASPDRRCPMVAANSRRPELARLFEVDRRVRLIPQPELEILAGKAPHLRKQGLEPATKALGRRGLDQAAPPAGPDFRIEAARRASSASRSEHLPLSPDPTRRRSARANARPTRRIRPWAAVRWPARFPGYSSRIQFSSDGTGLSSGPLNGSPAHLETPQAAEQGQIRGRIPPGPRAWQGRVQRAPFNAGFCAFCAFSGLF